MNSTAIILGGGAIGFGGMLSRAVFSPRNQSFGSVIWHGPRSDPPRIALTFDDGPDQNATPRVLDLLAELEVNAAFFVVGRHVESMPSLVKRIDSDGHIIGNHSFDHTNFGSLRWSKYWSEQVRRTDDVIEQITGRRATMFRPPMGIKTPHIVHAAQQQGHSIVTWSRRSRDGIETTSQRIQARLATSVSGGDIVLFHDGAAPPFRRNADAMIASLRPLILQWRQRGLTMVRLDELIGVSAMQPTTVSSR